MEARHSRYGRVLLSALVVMTIACGAEGPPRKVTEPQGGLVPVAVTKAAVHQHAVDVAQTVGASLIVVSEEKVDCTSESVQYTLDVYRIEGNYKIDVPPAERQVAVQKIKALWKRTGLKLAEDPAPNDVEAQSGKYFWMGVQPAREGTPLPLYVNSDCRTNPESVSRSSSS
jgi:hypothetical protein